MCHNENPTEKIKALDILRSENKTENYWKQYRPLIDAFYRYLHHKGLKPPAISRKINSVVLFTLNYIYLEKDITDLSRTPPGELDNFFTTYYRGIFPKAKPSRRKAFAKAILDFYGFLRSDKQYSMDNLEVMNRIYKRIN